MRPVRIRLDQGVNLASPPSDLKKGELALARNCHYEPESDSLKKVRGRTQFGAISAAAATGLSFVSFRNGNRYLIGAADTVYAAAQVGTTGTFNPITTLGTAAGRMDAIYYNGTDRAYIMDGVNAPQVWSGSGATRAMGLSSPTGVLTGSILANGLTNYRVATTFQYAFTEYDSVNDIESGPSSVLQLQSTGAGDTFKITIPPNLNAGATRFRFYRTQDGGDVFFRLAEFSTNFDTYYDGSNTEGSLPNRTDNTAFWGFATVDDFFLTTRPALPMLGSPLTGNYITVNGSVPVGNILTMFENSLIISGVSGFPQDVYYSQPDNPEMFSPIYFFREENARGEPVTGMGVANDRLMAFTLNSIFRHDTLPRVTDPGFGLSVASRQEVTRDHGCVAKRSVVNYGIGEPNNRLFYLSNRGPFSTDGYTTIPLSRDLDWSNLKINFAQIAKAVAVNYPRLFQIRLFLPSKDSLTNDLFWVYHYHPSHMKEGGIGKWTGPCHVRCDSATVVYESALETRLFIADTDSSGMVYLEDNGLVDAQLYENASGGINWEWQTGELDLGTQARNKRVGRTFLNILGTTASFPTLKYAMNQSDQEFTLQMANMTLNAPGVTQFGTSQVTANKTRMFRGGVWQTGSHIRFRMQETAASQERELVYLDMEMEDFGEQK